MTNEGSQQIAFVNQTDSRGRQSTELPPFLVVQSKSNELLPCLAKVNVVQFIIIGDLRG